MNVGRDEKPTTVRPPRPLVPPLLRWTMSHLGAVAPEATARLARHLFFTPRRARARDFEREVLARGERFDIRARGRRLACWSWGDGLTVLLVHGWSGHAGQMAAFVGPLLEAGFRVVAADMPGHGSSSGGRSSLIHFAEAIEDIAGALGGMQAVIAHSLGTSGTTLAMARGVRAERAVFFAPTASFEEIWRRFREGAGLSIPVWLRMVRRAEEWLGTPMEHVVPQGLAPRMKAPLLVLHDPADREIPFSQGAALAAAWPGARLRPVDAGGHVRMLRDPLCVAQAVEFVSSEFPARAQVDSAGRRREELRIEA